MTMMIMAAEAMMIFMRLLGLEIASGGEGIEVEVSDFEVTIFRQADCSGAVHIRFLSLAQRALCFGFGLGWG